MRALLVASLSIACLLLAGPSAPRAQAQNGQLIESLFRTWANVEAEKQRRKTLEAEERLRLESARRQAQPPRVPSGGVPPGRNPYELQLPSGFGQAPRVRPGVPPAGRSRQINVRNREVADYARELVQFTDGYGRLVQELRRGAAGNVALQSILPHAYEVSATCDTLLDQLDGAESLRIIETAHRTLDQRYRHVSYELRSINGLSDSCSKMIRDCDRVCSAMTKRLGIQPQFDRVALRDLMTTAATYMQALIDDLELTEMDRGRCRALTHDCRILRQQLLASGRDVDVMAYDDCVTRFSDFANRWHDFGRQVYALDNPFLSRRLDRISECGDRVYGLLWMPPPVSLSDVAGIAHRLSYNLKSISKSLDFFVLTQLSPAQQSQLLNAMRDLTTLAAELESLASTRGARSELRSRFQRFDEIWCGVQPVLGDVSSIRVGLIAETERGCAELREILDVAAGDASGNRFIDLVSVAAALEGTSEMLHQAVDTYARYLNPGSYRASVTQNARNFYRHSRDIHELLSRTERLADANHQRRLSEEAERLLADWELLSRDLDQIERRGLSPARASRLRRAEQEMVPLVGQIAAALVSR